MPIPVPKRVIPPASSYVVPPVPEKWGRTSVSIAGRNGEGEAISLTSFSDDAWPAIIMQPGATGLDAPPYALFSDDSPNLDGSIFRSTRAAAREIMIPVYLYGIDRPSVNRIKRQLFQALNPKRGYCVLRFTEGDSQTRLLKAYYKGGMEGSEASDTAGFTWTKYGLTFSAMDPWWYQTRYEVIRWDFGEGEPLLSSSQAFFPMRISSGVMSGGPNITISNSGDIEAWPIWALKGPIKTFALIGPYGDTIKASAPADGSDLIPTGRVVTIDTRPGYKTVMDDQGVNYWSRLDTNPQFWSVEPGDTTVSISVVTGVGKASVSLTYLPRYASYV
ncbi:phage tail domain-containing protein [Streptomyces sp. PsTaAH-124]|uniref:phage tail domain-containing protein n=1 Tax=Streptomyces sp. PsTaAH-124 TaxID=1157638 RepID=UPI000A30820C|nr:phage tail domain-containing protein [Streptomyces sp. PsTaAH-124]